MLNVQCKMVDSPLQKQMLNAGRINPRLQTECQTTAPAPPPSKVQCTTVQRAAQLSATRHIPSSQNTISPLDLLLTYTLRPPLLLFTACAYIS